MGRKKRSPLKGHENGSTQKGRKKGARRKDAQRGTDMGTGGQRGN